MDNKKKENTNSITCEKCGGDRFYRDPITNELKCVKCKPMERVAMPSDNFGC